MDPLAMGRLCSYLLATLALFAAASQATPVPMFKPGVYEGGRSLRQLPCKSRRTDEVGVCMFAMECMKANGTHLGTCIDRFYFGACCQLDIPNHLDPFPPPVEGPSSTQFPPLVTFQTIHDDTNANTISGVLLTKPPSTTPTAATPALTNRPPASTPIGAPQTTPQTTIKTSTTTTRTSTSTTTTTAKPTKAPPTTAKPVTTTKKPSVVTRPKPVESTTKTTTSAPKTTKPSTTTTTTTTITTTTKPTTTKKPVTKPKPSVTTTKRPTTPKPTTTTTTTNKQKPTTTTKKPTPTTTTTLPPSLITWTSLGETKPTTKRPLITTTTKRPITTKKPSSTATTTTKKPTTVTTTTTTIAQPTRKPAGSATTTTKKPSSVTTKKPPTPTTKAPSTTLSTTTPKTTTTTRPTTTEGWVQISVSTPSATEEISPSDVTSSTPKSPTTSASSSSTITSGKPITTESTSSTSSNGTTTTTASTETTSAWTDPPPLNMTNHKEVCGRRLFPESRIVGGSSSNFGKWPWQISLRQWRPQSNTYLHKCGAALLSEYWAITAAHCVENVPPSDLLLRIGEHDLSTEEEAYGYQERRVQIVASHPQFDARTFEYDLALLRFYEPVTFQPNILPVCVPEDDTDFVGREAYVTGWGRLYEDGPLPSVLQEVTVPVINNSRCETMYRSAGYIEHIPNIFICAGWAKGGKDSCEGDSGGPMSIQRPDKRWALAGVISWGIGCAEPNQPGVYTRISHFREWINQILQF